MDTGNGTFKMLDTEEYLKAMKENDGRYLFKVGEKVELNGSLFRVKGIKPDELRLKLLKRSEG